MDQTKLNADIARFLTEADGYLRSRFPSAGYDVRKATDDAVDAFRHAYVFGRLAQTYDPTVAFILGLGNEMKEGNTPEARDMDIYNNSVGIDYADATASPSALADRVVQGIRAGELVIRPGASPSALPSFGSGSSLSNSTLHGQLNKLISEMASFGADHAGFQASESQRLIPEGLDRQITFCKV